MAIFEDELLKQARACVDTELRELSDKAQQALAAHYEDPQTTHYLGGHRTKALYLLGEELKRRATMMRFSSAPCDKTKATEIVARMLAKNVLDGQ